MEIFSCEHIFFNIKLSNFPLEVYILQAMIMYDKILILLTF